MHTATAPAPANAFDNPEFRKEFRDTLDSKLEPIVKVVAVHEAKIAEMEAHIQRGRGATWVLNMVWGALLLAGEYLLHRGTH